MSAPLQARRYLWTFLGVITTALLLTLALNYFADPFRVFGVHRYAGFNDRKPFVLGFDRMAKPYEVLRVQPRTVLLGSSTAHSGFHEAGSWDMAFPRPFYNYALLGSNSREAYLTLQQTLRESPAELVVMVVDFYAYNTHYVENERFRADRLVAATRQQWPGFLGSDLAAFTLGTDAVGLSWTTFVESIGAKKDAQPSAPWWQDRRWGAIFRDMEHSYLARWTPPPLYRYAFASELPGSDRLADFENALRLSSEKGVRLLVLCPPIHARFQEAIAAAGVWSEYEQWKRELVSRVRAEQARPAGSGSIEFWDFSLFNELTTEGLPADGGTPMKYWYDSAHFTLEFGQRVLGEMLGASAAESPRLGVRLDQVELETHLAAIRTGLENFRAANPDVVADVRDALGKNPPRLTTVRP